MQVKNSASKIEMCFVSCGKQLNTLCKRKQNFCALLLDQELLPICTQ